LGNAADKSFSLYGLLNKCRTAMGSRRLLQWIKQPLLNIDDIGKWCFCRLLLCGFSSTGRGHHFAPPTEVRQNIVEIFVEDAELRQSMQEHFRRITDIDRLIKKFQRTRITASLKVHLLSTTCCWNDFFALHCILFIYLFIFVGAQDCVVLYDIYRRLPSMHATLSAYSTKNAGLLHEQYTDELAVRTTPAREAFASSSSGSYDALSSWDRAQRVIDEFSDFQRLIEGCIDLDAAQNNEYQINARFDPEFTQWCEEKEQVKQKIDTIFRAVGDPNPLINKLFSFLLKTLALLVGWCAPGSTRTGGGQAGQGQRRARKLEGSRVAYRRSEEGTYRTSDATFGANTNLSIITRRVRQS
jgi:DNA mismatch repair protein MSH2